MAQPEKLLSSESESIGREFIKTWSHYISLLETNTDRDVLTLLNVLEDVRVKWQKSEVKVKQMESKLNGLMTERENYLNDVENLRLHSERRNNKMQEAVDAKDKLQIELKYYCEQYSSTEQLLRKTQAENSELLKKFEDLKSADISVDDLNKEIQQLQNKNVCHEKQLTEQRAQLDQLKAKFDSKDKELEELQHLTRGFENKMKSQDELHQQQQTRLRQELEAARKTIKKYNETVFDFEACESSRGQTFDTLQHEYQVQIADLQKTLASYQNQVEGKTNEITQLLNSLRNAQSDCDNIDARLKATDDQLVASEQQIAVLKADLKASHERFETASNEHDAIVSRLRNSAAFLEKEKHRLNEELSELQTRDHERQLKMDTLYDKIQSLVQNSLLNFQMDTSSTGFTSQTVDDSLTSLNERINTLTTTNNELKQMTAEQDVELKQIKAERDQYYAQVQSLKDEIGASQTATASSHLIANNEGSNDESDSPETRLRKPYTAEEDNLLITIAKRLRLENPSMSYNKLFHATYKEFDHKMPGRSVDSAVGHLRRQLKNRLK